MPIQASILLEMILSLISLWKRDKGGEFSQIRNFPFYISGEYRWDGVRESIENKFNFANNLQATVSKFLGCLLDLFDR